MEEETSVVQEQDDVNATRCGFLYTEWVTLYFW